MLAFGKVVIGCDCVSADRKLVFQIEIESVLVDVEKLVSAGHNRFAHHVSVQRTYERIPAVSGFVEPRVI